MSDCLTLTKVTKKQSNMKIYEVRFRTNENDPVCNSQLVLSKAKAIEFAENLAPCFNEVWISAMTNGDDEFFTYDLSENIITIRG